AQAGREGGDAGDDQRERAGGDEAAWTCHVSLDVRTRPLDEPWNRMCVIARGCDRWPPASCPSDRRTPAAGRPAGCGARPAATPAPWSWPGTPPGLPDARRAG